MIDAEKYPIVEADGPYMQTYGFDLRVEVDLHGVLVLAADLDYDGYVTSYEHGSTIVVDASEAPKYRIDVTRDLVGGYADDGRPPNPTGVITVTGYDTGDYGTAGYDSATTGGDPTSGGTAYDPSGNAVYGGPIDPPGTSRPLRIPLNPRLAPTEMVLRCTLDTVETPATPDTPKKDVLHCKRDGSEAPLTWVFERDEEPVPAT